MRIGSVEDRERFGCRVIARLNAKRDPHFARSWHVNNSVRRYSAILRDRHTFAALEGARVNDAKGRIAAVANVNNTITNAGRGRPDHYLATAPLDFTGRKASYLRYSAGFAVDYIYTRGVTCQHPQFSSGPVVGEIIEPNRAVRAGKRNRLEFEVGISGASGAQSPNDVDQRDETDLCEFHDVFPSRNSSITTGGRRPDS